MPEKKTRRKRMVISDAAVPFVARGGRIFGGQVMDADLEMVDGEEILVVDKRDRILTSARAVVY